MLLSEIEAFGVSLPHPVVGNTYSIQIATQLQGEVWVYAGAGKLCSGILSQTADAVLYEVREILAENAVLEHFPELVYPAALNDHIRSGYDACMHFGNFMYVYKQEDGSYIITIDFYGNITELLIKDFYIWRTKTGYDTFMYHYGKYSTPAWLQEKITGNDPYMKYELTD